MANLAQADNRERIMLGESMPEPHHFHVTPVNSIFPAESEKSTKEAIPTPEVALFSDMEAASVIQKSRERSKHSRLRKVLGAVAIAGVLFGASADTAHAENYKVHTGDNLTQIAHDHHMSLTQLLSQNPDQKVTPGIIHPGEVLSLKSHVKAAKSYKVHQGDTLSAIADTNNISLSKVERLNPQLGPNFNLIHEGDQVILKVTSPKKLQTHKTAPRPTTSPAHTEQKKAAPEVKAAPQIKKAGEQKTEAPTDSIANAPTNEAPEVIELKHWDMTKTASTLGKIANSMKAPAQTKDVVEAPVLNLHAGPSVADILTATESLDTSGGTHTEDQKIKKNILAKLMPKHWAGMAKKIVGKHHVKKHKHISVSEREIDHFSVEEFMGAIAFQESKPKDEAKASATIKNPKTHAEGYFQIMPENWPEWSMQALGKVKKRTPENQIKVSRYKMQHYYNQLDHDWRAVAVAWFAGPKRAESYLHGNSHVLHMSDGHWTVRKYIDHMAANIGTKKANPYTIIPALKHLKKEEATHKTHGSSRQDHSKKKDSLLSLSIGKRAGKKIGEKRAKPSNSQEASKSKQPAEDKDTVEIVASVENTLPKYLKKIEKESTKSLEQLLKKEKHVKRRHSIKFEIKARKIIARRVVRIAKSEFNKYGNRMLETTGQNKGRIVQKYTNGKVGAWCSWFVGYVYKKAGYRFRDGLAHKDGSIPLVRNLNTWIKEKAIHFSARSKNLKPRGGDIIMFGQDTHTTEDDHVGVVTSRKGYKVRYIAGNQGNGIRSTTLDLKDGTNTRGVALGRPRHVSMRNIKASTPASSRF